MRQPTLPAVALTTATLLLLGSTAAHASHTQITVGGSASPASVPATMDNIDDPRNDPFFEDALTFETNFGIPIVCETTDADVHIKRGASISIGNTIGNVNQMALTDCFTFLDFEVQWTFRSSDIIVREHPINASDPLEVDVEVDSTVTDTGSGNACNFDVTGSMRAVFQPGDADADGYIVLQLGEDLLIDRAGSAGSTCGGEFVEGDLMSATGGTFALTTTGPNAGLVDHG